MRYFFLPVAFAVWSTANFVAAAPGNDAAALVKRYGQFSATCTVITLNDWTLEADCQSPSGSYLQSTLDLKQCLGWGSGGYILCQPGE